MNEEQIAAMAEAIARAVAAALSPTQVQKTEPTPSALAKSEQDQFAAGREAARKFNSKRGGRS